jgi:propane monooxygenase large subunit
VIVSRASITKSHPKIPELSWEPTFVSSAQRFATDYTFEKAPKTDPLKQVLRSYVPMEEERNNRLFGAMNVKRLCTNRCIDPARFDISEKA